MVRLKDNMGLAKKIPGVLLLTLAVLTQYIDACARVCVNAYVHVLTHKQLVVPFVANKIAFLFERWERIESFSSSFNLLNCLSFLWIEFQPDELTRRVKKRHMIYSMFLFLFNSD